MVLREEVVQFVLEETTFTWRWYEGGFSGGTEKLTWITDITPGVHKYGRGTNDRFGSGRSIDLFKRTIFIG